MRLLPGLAVAFFGPPAAFCGLLVVGSLSLGWYAAAAVRAAAVAVNVVQARYIWRTGRRLAR